MSSVRPVYPKTPSKLIVTFTLGAMILRIKCDINVASTRTCQSPRDCYTSTITFQGFFDMVPYVVATTRYGGQLEHSGFAVTLIEASQTDLRYQVCKLRTRYPFLYDDLYLNWLAWDPRYSNVYVPVVPSPPASLPPRVARHRPAPPSSL